MSSKYKEAYKVEVVGLRWPEGTPTTEFCLPFVQGMLNRMGVSFFKYGKVKDAYPEKVNALESMKLRLEKYAETGNTEHLIDAANYLMIEYMHPRRKDAYFKSTDSDGSPGRVKTDGVITTKHNLDLK